MKFDSLAKKLYLEARKPDEPERPLPERATATKEFSIGSAGARNLTYLPKKPSPEEIAVARGRARETETTEFVLDDGQKINIKGDLEKRKSTLYGVAAGEAFKRLKAKDFTPKTTHESESVREFMEWGMDEKLADAYYLMIRVMRNLFSLYDLDKQVGEGQAKVEKKIKILSDDGSVLSVSTIPLMAKETLQIFKNIAPDLVEENGLSTAFSIAPNGTLVAAEGRGNQETPERTKIRLGWKNLIAGLIQLTGGKGKEFVSWSRTTRQEKPKLNVLALDYRSTPTNWIIHTRKRVKDEESGGFLRQLSEPKSSTERIRRLYSDWPSYEKNEGINKLPLKFENGVPQYGIQLTEEDMKALTVDEMLAIVGYDTIWDVIYAWNRGDDFYEIPNTNKKINLKNLNISRYQLTIPPKEVRKREEKIAKTPIRPSYRPLPAQPETQAQ